MTAVNIRVDKDGAVQFLHDDATASLLRELGPVSTRRASHVEPYSELSQESQSLVRLGIDPFPYSWGEHFAGKWFADLGPVSGPVAGPFDTRTEALAFEKQWVEEHVLGVTSVQRDCSQSAEDVRDPACGHPQAADDVQDPQGQG